MAYEYTVYIKKDLKVDSAANAPKNDNQQNQQAPKVGDNKDDSSTTSLAKSMLVSEGKKYAMYAASNVDKYTGDAALQTDINVGIETVGLVTLTATNPFVALTKVAFDGVKTIADRVFEDAQQNVKLEMARARNGYTDTKSIMTSRRH